MKILMVASEFGSFAKTGGLADAVYGLSKALSNKNHEVAVVLPRYYIIDKRELKDFGFAFKVNMGVLGDISFGVFEKRLSKNLRLWFVDYELFFGRKGLYDDENGNPYTDNGIRFVFLSKAALEVAKRLNFKPDIVHAHDWHAAFVNALIKTKYKDDSFFKDTSSVLTIHNLQHQGLFDASLMNVMDIGWQHFNPFEFEALGMVNLLKGGIKFSDAISTVSRRYAEEIQTPQFGFGLDEHLKAHSCRLFGIINGVDYELWNPSTDRYIPKNYDMDSLENKIDSKRKLQEFFSLEKSDKPLIGFIGRLYEQKGIQLIIEAFDRMMQMNLEFVLLGSGKKWAEEFFKEKAEQYKGKFGCFIGYSEELAHLIEAGSDMFLMPSAFEPCGLNQIYSLRYGTIPIVHAVGGLVDTVENFDAQNEKGTGFVFYSFDTSALLNTLKWALDIYNDKYTFANLQRRAMSVRFDWQTQSEKYIKLYEFAKIYRSLKDG
ncbi:glycogen synthase GlgA [Hippea alviniae]|uniref:glycogen synthase GlgA n=1 Tax=Hippea alviniae TaxID=1279027 RepID=UPI0003B6E528|nr:glycogen synthase GlgA [Hippea alviniae]